VCTHTMRTIIRKLTPEHYKSVKDIFVEQFRKHTIPLSDLHISWRYRERDLSMGIFSVSGDLLGFALVEYDYISYIALHPQYQGMNLGHTLLRYILNQRISKRQSVHLYPLDQRRKLIQWYKSYGFYTTSHGYMNFHSHNTRRQSKYLRN